MAHMVDADVKSLVSVGEAARRADSRWALHISSTVCSSDVVRSDVTFRRI